MDSNETTSSGVEDDGRSSAAGHLGAPVSLTYDVPLMILVAILLGVLTLISLLCIRLNK